MPLCEANVGDSAEGTDHVDLGGDEQYLQDEESRKQSLKRESVRLDTFRNWPKSIPITPSDLAKDGFYYLSTGDRVKCIFCNLVLKNWEHGDVVRDEHRKFNSTCPFLLNRCVGNIAIEPEESVSSVPAFPEYSKPVVRRETLKNAPKIFEGNEDLFVDAGFFYTGNADGMKCFQCGGLLLNWEPEDDPWEEHHRWFPDCIHLRNRPVADDPFDDDSLVKTCLEMGYDRKFVEMAVARRRRSTAEDFSDLNALIDEVEKLKKQGNLARIYSQGKDLGAAAGASGASSGASSMEEEFRQLKEQRECKICAEREVEVVFIPCGHLVACQLCAHKLKECPICRQKIKSHVRTYMS